jgi:hypothetical protein
MTTSSWSAKASRPCCPFARRCPAFPSGRRSRRVTSGRSCCRRGLQRLYIAIDRDPAGQRAAERLSARAIEAGIAVRVLEPRLGDFNDDLRANGKEALRQHLAGRSGQRIGIACRLSSASRKGQSGKAGQGSSIPVEAVDRRLASSRAISSTRHPHGLQEMGRRPSKGPPLQGRGATDFRRRQSRLCIAKTNQPPPVLLHMRSGPEEGVKGRPQ